MWHTKIDLPAARGSDWRFRHRKSSTNITDLSMLNEGDGYQYRRAPQPRNTVNSDGWAFRCVGSRAIGGVVKCRLHHIEPFVDYLHRGSTTIIILHLQQLKVTRRERRAKVAWQSQGRRVRCHKRQDSIPKDGTTHTCAVSWGHGCDGCAAHRLMGLPLCLLPPPLRPGKLAHRRERRTPRSAS